MASKAQIIDERKANLELPEQPPVASDFNSADARTVNVGAGGQQENLGLAGTAASSGAGREAKDNLSGLPNDAAAQGSKNKEGLADTT
ncbi:hypothetical protein BU24DRAFT_423677, partial [Aaosphaeria arxii CBS 175.79]